MKILPMKMIIAIIIVTVLFFQTKLNAQVSININNNPPDSSAMLDIGSTNKGLLVPRMTETQRTSITNAATGLMIFQTNNVKGFYYWNGNEWQHMAEGVINMNSNYIPKWDGWQLLNSDIIDVNGKIGIGTNNPNAILEVSTTNSGVLLPRLTSQQRNVIVNPQIGLTIFNISRLCIEYYVGNNQWTSSEAAGTIKAFAGDTTTIPKGWLFCRGQAISRSIYSDLFAAIGINWGVGNGATTFNIPDLRGVFLRGVNGTRNDTYSDPDSNSRIDNGAGQKNNTGSMQDDTFQGHWHNIGYLDGTVYPMTNTMQGAAGSAKPVWGQTSSLIAVDPVADLVNGTPRTSSETRPSNAYVNYIIKY